MTIPKSVITIGRRAFYDCESLSSVNMESGVNIIGEEAFHGCSNLTNITIPETVTNIEKRAFFNCESLSIEEIPSGVNTIGEEAFHGCSNLSSVSIKAKNIENFAFSGCKNLKRVFIGKDVENISSLAFDFNNQSFEEINVLSDNKNYSSIDGILFNKEKTVIIKYPTGKHATSYTVPSGVTKIGDNSFWYCALKKVELPNGVTEIGESAFVGCNGLETIRIPKTVTKIGDNAFKDCPIAKIVTDKDAKYVTEFAKTNSIDYTEDDFSANVSYSTTNLTNQNVTVTIDASAGITQLPNGWNYKESSENKSITKIYTENGTENVTIKNENGTEIDLNISVNNIDKTAPVITKEINLASDKKSCYVKLTSNKEIQKVNRMDIVR